MTWHALNWQAGWWLILAGFASGAALGLFFHRPDWLGGYGSFQRRMLRLGHIACAALGMLNLIVGLSAQTSVWLIAGSVLMPVVCWLTAWKESCRHLFAVPVVLLVTAVAIILVNSKNEIRNPKQPQSTKEQTAPPKAQAQIAELPAFGFISDFEFRISDFTGGHL